MLTSPGASSIKNEDLVKCNRCRYTGRRDSFPLRLDGCTRLKACAPCQERHANQRQSAKEATQAPHAPPPDTKPRFRRPQTVAWDHVTSELMKARKEPCCCDFHFTLPDDHRALEPGLSRLEKAKEIARSFREITGYAFKYVRSF